MFTVAYISIIVISLTILSFIVRQKHEMYALLSYYVFGVVLHFTISPEDYNAYHIAMMTLALVVGVFIYDEFKFAAFLSYTLIPVNIIGYLLWYKGYSYDLYQVISATILIIQFISILPKALIDGITRPSDRHPLDGSDSFYSRKACGTMHKTPTIKKKS
jgi:hypothetical protein